MHASSRQHGSIDPHLQGVVTSAPAWNRHPAIDVVGPARQGSDPEAHRHPLVKKAESPPLPALRVLGWREWLALPEFGVRSIKAKLDTGARSSSLHVEAIEEFERDGAVWVRFALDARTRSGRRARWFEAPLSDRRMVTDSGGRAELRPFIRTPIRLGGEHFDIETNLTNRHGMMFPMLLGRTALAGRIVVDPARSFVLGDRTRKVRRMSEPSP
jgi:hypothetical protein